MEKASSLQNSGAPARTGSILRSSADSKADYHCFRRRSVRESMAGTAVEADLMVEAMAAEEQVGSEPEVAQR